MAIIDISSASGGFTKTDPSSTFTETKYRLRWEDHGSSDVAYQYKAIATEDNFEHYATLSFDSSSGLSAMGVWCVTDTVNTIESLKNNASASALMLWLKDNGSECKLYLTERDSAYVNSDEVVTLAETYRNKPLFLKINRTSSTFTATIYRDPRYEEQLYQITKTLNSVQDYTNLLIAQSSGDITVFESYEGTEFTHSTLISGNTRSQGFTPSTSHDVEIVSVGIKRIGTGATSVQAELYASSGGLPTGSVLATSDAVDCSAISTSLVWIDFAFPTPYNVSASTAYCIVMQTNSASGDNNVQWVLGNADLYAGGAFGYNGTEYTVYDCLFKEGTGYIGTANGFSGELYLDETPDLWEKEVCNPLMAIDDSDDFDGFPTSNETWSTAGSGTVEESEDWSSDGDGKSLKIIESNTATTATFTPSVTTLEGFVTSFDFRITALGENQKSIICLATDGSNYSYAYVQDVSGTKYFRLGDSVGGANSTATSVECELDTDYRIVFSSEGKSDMTTLVIDNRLADNGENLGNADFKVDTFTFGGVGTGNYGTRYYDNFKYMNGSAKYPTICRGGNNDETIVVTFNREGTTPIPIGVTTYVMYSTDEGDTWSEVTTFQSGSYLYGNLRTVWDPTSENWYFFLLRDNLSINQQMLIYECSSLTTPTITLLETHSDVTYDFQIAPTRDFDADGKLIIGMSYLDPDDPDDNYVTSGLMDLSDGSISGEYALGNFEDDATYTWVTEPNIWVSNGVMYGLIRNSNPTYHSNCTESYRISDDFGASDWDTNTLYDPGTDWFMKAGWMRGFVYKGFCYWTGRDAFLDVGNRYHYEQSEYTTFIMKTDATPDSNNLIPVSSEYWEESYGLGGNGDIDGKVSGGESVYVDMVNALWGGQGWYMKLYTGEISTQKYTIGDYSSLPTTDYNLENDYSPQDYIDVATSNNTRVSQTATSEYAIHQFKDYGGTDESADLSWEGQSDVAPSSATVYLQIYNHDTPAWETVDSDGATAADTDFELSGNIADLTNYKDGDNLVSCRVYQNGTVDLATDYWNVDFSSSFAIADVNSASSIDNIVLEAEAGDFVIADIDSASTIDNIDLELESGEFAIDNIDSASSIDEITLEGNFIIDNVNSLSSIDEVTLARNGGDFVIDNVNSLSSIDEITLEGNFIIDNLDSLSSIDEVTLERNGGDFVIDNANSLSSIDNIEISSADVADLDKNNQLYIDSIGGKVIELGNSTINTWNTLGRPTAKKGVIGYNTELESLEIYNGSAWVLAERLDDGTATGQMTYWDGSKWTHTEITELSWDDTDKTQFVDNIQLSLTPTTTAGEGLISWNVDDGTPQVGMPGGNVTLQIGQELLLPRGKAVGTAIDNGQLVYISGASGFKPELTLAKADTAATSKGTIAMATEDILENANGYYTAFGDVRDIAVPTATYSDGDTLYLSSTTAGGFTNVKPVQPNLIIKIGYVIKAHDTEGIIFVNIHQRTNDFEHIRGLTAGSIPFANQHGFLDEDNSNLFYDYTNKRLGIGTDSPSATATVSKKQDAGEVNILDLKIEELSTGNFSYPAIRLYAQTIGGDSFNAGKIYSIFDANSYTEARTTIASPAGDNAWVDVLSIKDGKAGFNQNNPDSLVHIGNTRFNDDGHIGTYGVAPDANIPLHLRRESDSDGTILKIDLTGSTTGNNQEAIQEFWSPTGGGVTSFNAAKLYSKFDSGGYDSARFTIASPTGGGVWTDVLSIKDGKVGIGTDDPDGLLHTYSTDHNYGIQQTDEGWVTMFIDGAGTHDHAFFYDNAHDFRMLASTTNVGGTSVESMRYRADGAIGHVDHIFTMKDDSDVSYMSALADGTAGYDPGWVSFFGSNRYNPAILWNDGNDLRFLANADNQKGGTTTEVMRLTDNTRVSIGAGASPGAKVEILSTSTQLRLTHTDGVDECDFLVDGDGDTFITPSSGNLWIGNGGDVDYTLGFYGNTNQGVITFMEDENYFGFDRTIQLRTGTAIAGTAPIKFTAGTLLTTPEAGAIEFNDNKFYITNVGHQRAIDRTSDVLLSTVTVANTTTETTLWTGEMDANSLIAGNMFKFHADGIVSNGGPTAGDEVTVRIKVGGVTVVTLNPTTKTLTDTMWHLDANATQRTLGATGARAVHIHLVIGDPASTGDEQFMIGVATIDTTANMDVTITAEWASADVANTISLYQGYMHYGN